MQILSLAPSTLGNPPALDIIPAAAAAKFEALGLRMMPPPRWFRSDPDDQIETTPAREIRARLDEFNLKVLALNAIYLAPETDERYLAGLLDDAAEIGAQFYQVVVLDSDRDRALKNFALAASLAKTRGVRLGIEFKDDSTVETIEQAEKFAVDSGCAGIGGICLDVLHLSRSGGKPADIEKVDPALVFYVELSDASKELPSSAATIRQESRKQRLLPGQGGLWISDVLKRVAKDIPLHVEAPGASRPDLSLAENAKVAAEVTRRYLAEQKR